MANAKNPNMLKKYMKELEALKEKKRVLEENEQRHVAPTKKKSKKVIESKKVTTPKKTPTTKKPSSKVKPKAKPKQVAKQVPKLIVKKAKPKKVQVPTKIKQKKVNIPQPEVQKKTAEEEADEEEFSDEEIQNFQVGKTNMEQLIYSVCEILAKSQTDGVPQTEVWHKLKLTVRDGFRLALKLEWLGIISREKVLEKGRWTYKLLLKRTPISTRSIIDAPCLTCPIEQKCTPDGEVSPYTCDLIRDWVIVEAKRLRKR